MQEKEKIPTYSTLPNGQPVKMGEGEHDIKETGTGTFEGTIKIESTKTHALLFLLIFVAHAENAGEPSKEAARAIAVIYGNFDHFEIILPEPGGVFTFNWKLKKGIKEEIALEELKEILKFQIVRGAITTVWPNTKIERTGEVKKDGGPVKMSSHMAKMSLPEKDKTTSSKPIYSKAKINLSPTERKVERAILKILRDNSTLDREHKEYLMGNNGENKTKVSIWDSKTESVNVGEIPYAGILFDWADLCEAYTGKKATKVSGKERQTLRDTLESLKRQHISAVWQKEINHEGTKMVQRFKLDHPLILEGALGVFTPEEAELINGGEPAKEEREKILLLLHPAYTADIKDKSFTLPADYDQRLQKYVGKGNRMKDSWERLITYLNTVRCGGVKDTIADLTTLIEMTSLQSLKAKQGLPKVRAEIEDGFNLAKAIGLTLSHERKAGAKGQEQYTVTFNPDFTK